MLLGRLRHGSALPAPDLFHPGRAFLTWASLQKGLLLASQELFQVFLFGHPLSVQQCTELCPRVLPSQVVERQTCLLQFRSHPELTSSLPSLGSAE